jgi:hypothetical protein
MSKKFLIKLQGKAKIGDFPTNTIFVEYNRLPTLGWYSILEKNYGFFFAL